MSAEVNKSLLKRAVAFYCHHCPVCAFARKHPESLIGRILLHPWHSDRCPFWKAEKELYGKA